MSSQTVYENGDSIRILQQQQQQTQTQAKIAPLLQQHQLFHEVSDETNAMNHNKTNQQSSGREGSITSACINLLCTMVGGGSLSLPMAFQKCGNGFVGPLMVLLIGALTEFGFERLIDCSNALTTIIEEEAAEDEEGDEETKEEEEEELEMMEQEGTMTIWRSSPRRRGRRRSTTVAVTTTFEGIVQAAFGIRGFIFSKWLITAMCFFGSITYSILLRDTLQPITHVIVSYAKDNNESHGKQGGSLSLADNITMWVVVLLTTPLCTMKTLSSLRYVGAASMCSILILGCCVVYRSIQCNCGMGPYHNNSSNNGDNIPLAYSDSSTTNSSNSNDHNTSLFRLWPVSPKALLDTFPIFVSVYVSHYNVPKIHNELKNPTKSRVRCWLRSTTIIATTFYCIIGIVGSAYSTCTPSGKIHGNILLDFHQNDPLLFVGRMCLAMTLVFAFPLLIIPPRDIILQSFFYKLIKHKRPSFSTPSMFLESTATNASSGKDSGDESFLLLREPLLKTIQNPTAEYQQQHSEEESDLLAHSISPSESFLSSSLSPAGVLVTGEEQAAQQQVPVTEISSPTNNHNNNYSHESAGNAVTSSSFLLRLMICILIFWSATFVASCVESIDVIMDLLGSSFSVIVSYLIPASTYLIIVVGRQQRRTTAATLTTTTIAGQMNNFNDNIMVNNDEDVTICNRLNTINNDYTTATTTTNDNSASTTIKIKETCVLIIAYLFVILGLPLMIISTINAVFFEN